MGSQLGRKMTVSKESFGWMEEVLMELEVEVEVDVGVKVEVEMRF